jgi:hypothetical protein
MCPVGWSDEEGEGMAVCWDEEPGVAVEKLKMGVAICSVITGDENEEGVEAWSVANRSGVGEEAGLKIPHPRIKIRAVVIHKTLVLFRIQLD